MALKLSDHFNHRRLLWFALPSIIMMIISSIYTIVDGFFVSNFVGKTPFAALNLIFPVLMAIGAFGFMIGTGGTALVAKTLGEGKKEKANRIFSMLIQTLVIVGVVTAAVAFIFLPQIAKLLGATDAMLGDCVLYGRIMLIGNTFFMLQCAFSSFLVVAEKSSLALIVSILAGGTNILLDYLLMVVFPMGLLGAGVATITGQFIGAVVPMCYFIFNKKCALKLRFAKMQASPIFRAMGNGASEMLTNLSASVVGMLYNFQLMRISPEDGVAAYGVIMYVSFIFTAIFFGYAIGVGPIIGYNYGAQNRTELKSVIRKSLKIHVVVSLAIALLSVLLAGPLSKIFASYDQALCDLTIRGMQIYSISFLFSGFNIYFSAMFTSLNNGLVSGVLSASRTLVFQIVAVIILPIFFGIDGIWSSVILAEVLALIVGTTFYCAKRKKYGY